MTVSLPVHRSVCLIASFWQELAASQTSVLHGFVVRFSQDFDAPSARTQNMGYSLRRPFAHGAPTSHQSHFAPEMYEIKAFLTMLVPCDDRIAPSWGRAGTNQTAPCSNRGRQQKWYKEFSPLHSQRFWRWHTDFRRVFRTSGNRPCSGRAG